MDEFGSPLSGGIRAVRRNISSSFLGAPQRQQPDTITTNLLQEQSLKLSSVSGQLQNISSQVSNLDTNIRSVKENLALSDQLERQREAAKQNRERQLAEQGLREGKESALEQKIQMGLAQPLQKIGVRTQGVLSRLTSFLFTLAGGWLTITGIDFLQAMAEGNVDKINKLKSRFLVGLTVLIGSLTAIQIGIKKTIGLLAGFAGNIARVAFGGVLKGALTGVKLLLGGLVKKVALLTLGGGGLLAFLKGVGQILISSLILRKGEKIVGGLVKSKATQQAIQGLGSRGFTPLSGTQSKGILSPAKNIFKRFNPSAAKQLPATTKPGILGGIRNFFQGTEKFQPVPSKLNTQKFFTGSDPTMAAGQLNKPVSLGRSGGIISKTKNFLKASSKTGIIGKATKLFDGVGKSAAGKVVKKVFAPLGSLITFFSELFSKDGGLVSALSAVGGYLAGAKIGAMFFGALGTLLGGVGSVPLAAIGAIVGGFLGEDLIKNLSKKIMSALGLKDIKFNKNKKDGNEVEGVNGDAKNITPQKNENLNVAEMISNFDEDGRQNFLLGQNNTSTSSGGGAGVTEEKSRSIPAITSSDSSNPYVLAATVNYGI
tara:strand:- start:6538 stop:8334 length:1797 start_codon:yes stop_codon:yes gene_type:complete